MSEKARYEEIDQQFNQLPMPDEEASWKKMKELLDDDGDDIVPPPVFLKSCLGWSILLLAGLTIAWFMVRPEKWWNESWKTDQTSSSNKNQDDVVKKTPAKNNHIPSKQDSDKKTTEKKITSSQPLNQEDEIRNVTDSKQKKNPSPDKLQSIQPIKRNISTDKPPVSNKDPLKKKRINIAKIQRSVLRKEQKQVFEIIRNEKIRKDDPKKQDSVLVNQKPDKIPGNIITSDKDKRSDTATVIKSTPTATPVDTVKRVNAEQPKDSLNQSRTNSKQKKLFLAAGIGEQQLIPIAGQTAVPYSRYGRKSSFADYVPSVFIQLQKENKWFVLTEFRYGAAQSVKELSYNQNTKYDAASSNITTTTMRLKKTYYHQLPVSFNYFIIPNLSLGIGGMYSHFYGAVTEKEITTFNTQTQFLSTIKQIIPVKHFTDSFLYKTQVHALLQADYHWKKFSFGLRYTKDIQPYIKYTKPDGTVDEEKNQSLQFIIRYRLWQSRKS
jgi:hypothetical protein